MSTIHTAWPRHDNPAYEALAERFRPVFARIAEGAAERDRVRELPRDAVRRLRDARFGAVRLPVAAGGAGASLNDLFALLTELAESDSNLTQILRAHFGFVETLLFEPDTDWARRWLPRVAAGDIFSPGWTEPAGASFKEFSTRLEGAEDALRLDGRKFYTTGALYADWIAVGATRGADETVTVVVPADAPGVTVVDDWNGFGQVLTGSGTAIFEQVAATESDVQAVAGRSPFVIAFYQIAHLAALAGIGRAAAAAAARYIAERKRTYSHGVGALAREDPQVLQSIGGVHARVYAANALTIMAAAALDRAVAKGDPADAPRLDTEVYQAQVVVSAQVLEAVTVMFHALGASALDRSLSLDRFWRNARTIASHNPLVYKERLIGDYVVNGTAPPTSWLAGTA